jgi:hypothetical protein
MAVWSMLFPANKVRMAWLIAGLALDGEDCGAASCENETHAIMRKERDLRRNMNVSAWVPTIPLAHVAGKDGGLGFWLQPQSTASGAKRIWALAFGPRGGSRPSGPLWLFVCALVGGAGL